MSERRVFGGRLNPGSSDEENEKEMEEDGNENYGSG